MKGYFHVKKNNATIESCNTYREAVSHACGEYTFAKDDDKLEVVHLSLVVWGPFVKGGKYDPRPDLNQDFSDDV